MYSKDKKGSQYDCLFYLYWFALWLKKRSMPFVVFGNY